MCQSRNAFYVNQTERDVNQSRMTDRVYSRDLVVQRKPAPSLEKLLGETLRLETETGYQSFDSVFNPKFFDFVTPFQLPIFEYL